MKTTILTAKTLGWKRARNKVLKRLCNRFSCMYLLLVCILPACDSHKKSRNPELQQITEYTLNLGRDSITLGYLQRDTINIASVGESANSSYTSNGKSGTISWHIRQGDSCISMIGNVVIGRRKGTATLIAKCNDEFGKITVNVTSEEYIPIDKVIFEINGEMHTTGDTLYFPTCETAEVKWIGVEPQNATWSRVGRSLLWSTLSNGEKSIANDEEWMLRQQGIDTAITKLNGFVHELDDFKFLVHPTIEHGIWADEAYSSSRSRENRTQKSFIPNDSIPSWVFDVYLELWPKDMERSEWDIMQLKKHFSKEQIKEQSAVVCKRICFADLDNRIEIESEAEHLQEGSSRLFIHAGETKQLEAALFAPKGWENYVTWEDANIQSIHDYKLLLEKDGRLHLPSDFSAKYLQGFGYSEKELAQDTVYIGRINAFLMKEPYKSQWLEQYNFIKWNTPKVETIKSNPASVYWVKSVGD